MLKEVEALGLMNSAKQALELAIERERDTPEVRSAVASLSAAIESLKKDVAAKGLSPGA